MSPRAYVVRGGWPLWIAALLLIPLALVFLTSLLLAAVLVAVVGAIVALFLPRRRPATRRSDSDVIELDPSEYRRVDPRSDSRP